MIITQFADTFLCVPSVIVYQTFTEQVVEIAQT